MSTIDIQPVGTITSINISGVNYHRTMEKTPKNNKLALLKRKESLRHDESSIVFEPQIASTGTELTPTASKSWQDNDFSPLYFPMSQEVDGNVDVVWDWRSPNGDQKRKKPRPKRLLQPQSPKYPIKRTNTQAQTQKFDRLREELKALQEELARPDDESCLCVSPQHENEFKETPLSTRTPEPDVFDDSLDDQLVMFSQQVEADIRQCAEKISCNKKVEITSVPSTSNLPIQLPESSVVETILSTSFQTKELAKNLFGRPSKSVIQRTKSENVIHMASGKLEMHRTKSFEMEHLNVNPSILAEIEKKRQAALALREAKQKSGVCTQSTKTSPIYSEKEIEEKRKQALEKLEHKRMLERCEKNRQEALLKLQRSRMKNAEKSQVKSDLDKRL